MTAKTYKLASKILGVTTKTITRTVKELPGCKTKMGIDTEMVARYLEENGRRNSPDIKAAKLKVQQETARKLKIQNDLKQGMLIERASVISAFKSCKGRLDDYRLRSEQEHALLFAGFNGDIPRNREQVKRMWDEILKAFQEMQDVWKPLGL